MFCAKCGKKIDDDSAFCPYCGQKVNAKTGAGKPSRGVSEKTPLSEIIKKNKTVIGTAVALVVVVAVVFGGVKLLGGSKFKVPLEKIFAMSWEESSDMTISDIREMLDEEGIIYEVEKSNYSGEIITTRVLDEFMGNDAFFRFIEYDGNGRNILNYDVVYETSDDLKEARKELEDYLNKKLIKNTQVCSFVTGDDSICSIYVIDRSDKNKDVFLNFDTSSADTAADVATEAAVDADSSSDSYQETSDSEPIIDLDNCSVYKIVQVWYENVDTSDAPGGKSYIDYVCNINVAYRLMSQEDYISYMARYGYDAIKGKEIDVAKFQESLDKSFIDILDVDGKTSNYSSDERKEYENRVYSKLYMMEEHNYDTEHGLYFGTDDEKRLWYIQNYKWDTETKSVVDLSAYKNSAEVYCAVECDYNINEAKFFENDLEKALYLADKDYNMQTGEGFRGTDEKRLYFMQNYSYDTSTGETVDKEVVDALIAYQKYVDEKSILDFDGDGVSDWNEEYVYKNTIALAYIDDDDIPELVIYFSTGSSTELNILSYQNGNVIRGYIYGRFVFMDYVEKKNLLRVAAEGSGYHSDYADTFYNLVNGELNMVAEGHYYSDYDANKRFYYFNEEECSNEDDYIRRIDDFCRSQIDEAGWREIDENYYTNDSILAAYDALRIKRYRAYTDCIYQFEVNDGILSVSAEDIYNNMGVMLISHHAPFSFSYPISEDCIWEDGYRFGEARNQNEVRETDMETVMADIRNPEEANSYEILFCIEDDVVVGVYTSTP